MIADIIRFGVCVSCSTYVEVMRNTTNSYLISRYLYVLLLLRHTNFFFNGIVIGSLIKL